MLAKIQLNSELIRGSAQQVFGLRPKKRIELVVTKFAAVEADPDKESAIEPIPDVIRVRIVELSMRLGGSAPYRRCWRDLVFALRLRILLAVW